MSGAALSAGHAAVLEAMLSRLIPSDELGPGAGEAGVMSYLEAALGAWHGHHAGAYAIGLEQLDQRAHRELGQGFAACEASDQDALLAATEHDPGSAAFFELVRVHAIEGMFGDPSHGGNAGGAGWDLLGYPGPRREWSAEDQQIAALEPGPRVSDADVLIIGLGGAGGIAADVLTRAGAQVLALEAGERVATGDSRFDEISNDLQARLSAPKALAEMPTWRQDREGEATRAPWPVLMVNAVGGSTVHYPGLSARFHPWNFRSASSTLERYGAGAVPAGSTLADWPLSYEELEADYEAVERAIGVSGAAGNLGGSLTGDGSAFEGPRVNPYPMAPLRRTGWTQLTDAAARSLGWHPFPAPAAINSVPYNGNPECTYCGFCQGNICHRDAKGSTDANVIRRAEETGLLNVVTGARVTRIEVDGEGLACGATYVKDGREQLARARWVVLATFTYENVRLLLLSAGAAHPDGLSNNSGQVGRHYMAHVTPFEYGLFPGRRLNLFNGTWTQATCVDDWNADNFDHSGLGFIGGALLTASQELRPIGAASAAPAPGVPRWGSGWKAWLKQHGQSVGSLTAQVENLSYEDNYLDLDPVARDPFGLPVIRVTHHIHEHERTSAEFMRERMRSWLTAAGASETWNEGRLVVEARHCYGGTRMGHDPAQSVCDAYGFSHEVPNLAILGTSLFPTTGGHNPTLTLQALARRTATRLAERC